MIRYDVIRWLAYGISPEGAYLDIKLREKIESGLEGAVVGLSYEQRGLDFEKIEKNLACLAGATKDLYSNYQDFLWLYDEVVNKRRGTIKYCVLGMNFYRLWYDLSLSDNKVRMLDLYKKSGCVHHFHDMDTWLPEYNEDIKICEELMVENYMDMDYCDNFHPELYYGRVTEEYEPTKETYQEDIQNVKRVFHKPYPNTFKENSGILERFLKFLYLHDIKILVYIPPFPKVFNEYTSADMKEATLHLLLELKEIYEFELLDLSDHEMFENRHFADWSHLNSYGADLATELLNDYIRSIWE